MRPLHALLYATTVMGLTHCAVANNEQTAETTSFATTSQKFLTADGVGSVAEATSYYASLGENVVPGTYTLDQWLAENIAARPTNDALYRNSTELGFWREMKCTKYVGRGLGGCMVRNWLDPSDIDAGRPDQGTVTMNVSPDGSTRFYVFAPGGKLSPAAILDSEGEKFVPRVCVSCHNGSYDGKGAPSDLGAIFREFEPSILEAPSGTPVSSLQPAWYRLNQSIRSANFAVRTEKEGSVYGTDHARDAQDAYVSRMYTSTSPPVPLDVRDPTHLPPSWAKIGDTPDLLAAKKQLWTDVVAPYCMTCHRTNSSDWADYEQFSSLSYTVQGKSFLELYTAVEAEHRPGFPYMPQAKLLFDSLHADARVAPAIKGWLRAVAGPACAVGTTCVPSKVCFRGAIEACDGPKLQLSCKPTVPVENGTPCGDEAKCVDGQCVSSLTITLPRVATGVYVRLSGPSAPEAHVHLEANHDLFVTQISSEGLCTERATETALPCSTTTRTCTSTATGDSWRLIGPAMLMRKYPAHPELEGTYRRESPIDVSACP